MSHYYWFNAVSQHEADVRNGRIRGPHVEWRGPVAGAYVYPDKPALVLHFHDRGDMEKIREIDFSAMIGSALQDQRGKWTGEVPRVNLRLGKIYLTKPVASLAEIEALIRQTHADDVQKEAAIQADPLALLDRELSSKDWYSHMSDDFSCWSAGEASDRRIKELWEKLSDEQKVEVRNLVAKYAPKDFTCPF